MPEAAWSILAGHRDTHFAFIEHLVPGDRIVLESPARARAAFVVRDHAILNEPVLRIPPAPTGTLLVLSTCWPFDASLPLTTSRYVVVAEAVPDGP